MPQSSGVTAQIVEQKDDRKMDKTARAATKNKGSNKGNPGRKASGRDNAARTPGARNSPSMSPVDSKQGPKSAIDSLQEPANNPFGAQQVTTVPNLPCLSLDSNPFPNILCQSVLIFLPCSTIITQLGHHHPLLFLALLVQATAALSCTERVSRSESGGSIVVLTARPPPSPKNTVPRAPGGLLQGSLDKPWPVAPFAWWEKPNKFARGLAATRTA